MPENLLSIIIPVYNCEASIGALLQAVLDNPYSNFEVLVGDDCSTDLTTQKISQFQNDSKVRIFKATRRMGAGAMRNWLLSEAKGKYIGIQDADDSFNPIRFIEQVRFLENNAVDVVGSAAELVDSSGRSWGMIYPPEKPTYFSWIRQNSVVHASIVFKKAIIGDAKYHESLKYGEDYYFLTQLYLQGARFRNVLEPFYRYHIEKDKLRKRDVLKNWEAFKGKLETARLFSFPQKCLFLVVNSITNILSFLKSL